MNKKLRVLFSLALLLSKPAIANSYECEESCDPCQETTNTFCGGYVGANFNFGSVNFLSRQEVKTETASSADNGDSVTAFELQEITKKDSCLREALNTVGGGVTLGWAWANSCWYLAAEFNGLFYGNPNSNLSDDCCDTSCNDKCCGYLSEVSVRESSTITLQEQDGYIDKQSSSYTHRYKNNVRLDGVAKVGFILNPYTALYALGGGSGLLVQYSNAINATANFNQPTDGPTFSNDANNNFCCNKWVGGGTIGFGSRMSWCDCLDVVIEGRYARYGNTCYENSKPNDIENDFDQVQPSDLEEQDSTKFRTDSYMALLGVNWRF